MPLSATSIAGFCITTGEVVNIADCYMDERFDAQVDRKTGFRTKQMLCVPIKNRSGCIVGAIQLINNSKHVSFNEHDIMLVRGFAVYVVAAIEAHAAQESLELFGDSSVVASACSIGSKLALATSPDELCESLFPQCMESLGCDYCAIHLPSSAESQSSTVVSPSVASIYELERAGDTGMDYILYDSLRGWGTLGETTASTVHVPSASIVGTLGLQGGFVNMSIKSGHVYSGTIETSDVLHGNLGQRAWMEAWAEREGAQLHSDEVQCTADVDFPSEQLVERRWKNLLMIAFPTSRGRVVFSCMGKAVKKNFSVADEEMLVLVAQQALGCLLQVQSARELDESLQREARAC